MARDSGQIVLVTIRILPAGEIRKKQTHFTDFRLHRRTADGYTEGLQQTGLAAGYSPVDQLDGSAGAHPGAHILLQRGRPLLREHFFK